MSWGLAVELGALKERVSAIERELSTIRHWGIRFCILIVLWLTAVVSNMNAETAAQLITGVLRAL
jgi:hypothetical protein